MCWTEGLHDEFEAAGVVILPGVLRREDTQPVIDELSAWIDARARKLHARGEIHDLHETAPFETRYALLFAQSPAIARGLDIMYYRGEAMFRFLRNARLLDALEPILGPEITCNPIQHLRAKPPAILEGHERPSFHNAAWHQDAGVMMTEAEHSQIVTCWLPLGDSTMEMGCLRALPGVSQGGYLEHVRGEETHIDPECLPDTPPRYLECQRGDLVLMNRFTPHSSLPNRSDRCRWSLDLRYQTTGHHTGRTAHPEFVVRSRAHPEQIEEDHAAWSARWLHAFEHPQGFAGHRIDQP